MDLIILFTTASGLLVILFIIALIKQKRGNDGATAEPERPAARPLPRRGVAQVRGARARLMRAGAGQHDDDDEEEDVDGPNIELPDGKIGTKKRAKLEAKAERKSHREAEERIREDRKKKQEQEEEERKHAAEQERLEEAKREEEERRAREEKERQEQEEYEKLRAAFSVEEEGYEEGEVESEGDLLQEFISHIKNSKVVVLEDLASHFKLKTQNVIDRIQELQTEGTLTGVIDDRGKFIYISQEELQAVAKFVKQRGRVSIVELAESSNQLINLTSTLGQPVSS